MEHLQVIIFFKDLKKNTHIHTLIQYYLKWNLLKRIIKEDGNNM